MSDVTEILYRIEKGDPSAAEQLLPLVYDELRKLAAAKMAREKPGQTLQATALVHEAYLRLVEVEQVQHWNSRGHFFGAAAEAMRRILVESARQRAAEKRGGGVVHQTLEERSLPGRSPDQELLCVHEAVDKLAAEDGLAAELVKLRYFAGLTMDEAATALGISVRKAHYDWAYARSWLRRELGDT